MSDKIFGELLLITLIVGFAGIESSEGGILDTKHNLSVSGPGPVKAAAEERVCVFCHTPHRARSDIPYLWNRRLYIASYVTYRSSTLYAAVGQPTGASKLCLSCHDGTIALGSVITKSQEIPFAGGIRVTPEGPARVGTDLSDDHPVSFDYDSRLAAQNPELLDPAALPAEVKLDSHGELQCTTCHDPHNDRYGKFLVMPDQYGRLCTTCHEKEGWPGSSHSTSKALWNRRGPNPWISTPYATVEENGCENCHKPHTAGGHERLLNYAVEEDNCLVCHNGNVASTNIERELTKPYRHAVQDYTAVHDPSEDFTSGTVPKHVECTDCHDPHHVNSDLSPGAPQISGALRGVEGIDAGGRLIRPALHEYETCFNCHGDFGVISVLPITRKIDQLNTRLEFDQGNPSFHPVEGPGINVDVPSLLPPYTINSIIYCTDCHNNDSPGGPAGPHGSQNRYLLAQNYTTDDLTTETPFNYGLCYQCHDRNSILRGESFKDHGLHVEGERAPCSACHDPHGISLTQGNSVNNSHLINFDLTIVQPDSQGRLSFEDLGRFRGRCFLNCHGNNHEPLEYPDTMIIQGDRN